ncbi:hypothetical protein ANAEL_03351 [Anaerolineales bacterium]|nr:hypothetical protein ANAEL_03351 [Anaerolineales bacterium]
MKPFGGKCGLAISGRRGKQCQFAVLVQAALQTLLQACTRHAAFAPKWNVEFGYEELASHCFQLYTTSEEKTQGMDAFPFVFSQISGG